MKTINFLIVLLVTASLSACCCQNKSCEQPEKTDKSIGLQLYSLRDDIHADFNKTIADIGEMGYKQVEAAGYGDGKFYGLSPEEFKAAIEGAGMIAISSHTGRDLGQDANNPKWDEIWAWWDQCIAAHKAAGMKYIVTPGMPTPQTKTELQAYCDYYNQIGERCNAAGLKFGYHNHSFEFEKKYEDGTVFYEYMVENTDPAKVFFQLDVYWAVIARRSPVDLFEKYPNRFELLHIKDDKELGASGMVGFDAIFNNIDKAGTKYLIVEVEKYSYIPKESIQKSLDYLLEAPFVKADYSK